MPRVRGEIARGGAATQTSGGGSVHAGEAGRSRGVGSRRRGSDGRAPRRDGDERDLKPEQFVEVQRARVLAGVAAAIDMVGYERATVAHITERAGISRRTFYELFDDREACIAALVEGVVGELERELAQADLAVLPWCERIRGGLLAILRFLDREPVLARLCVVEALGGGGRVLELRERVLARLADAVDEGRAQSARGEGCTPLLAEGLVGATLAIVHRRLLHRGGEPLVSLVGELMGLIVLPYLGPAAARREQARPVPPAPAMHVRAARIDGDPLRQLPMRLTYRTIRVLDGIGERPGLSNRAIGDLAGIADAGQISKLLARLERVELVLNAGAGHSKGVPNAWRLTPLGDELVRRFAVSSRDGSRPA